MLRTRTSLILIGVFALTLLAGTFAQDSVRPRVQALVSMTGQGNEQVYLTGNGWMYYRPALEHVWGRPIADARPAISHFREELLRAGIELVVVPVPVKASIDTRPMGVDGNPVNPGWKDFLTELRRYEIPYVDAQEILQKRGGERYMRGDSHWRPESMDAVAAAVAETVHEMGLPRREKLARSPAILIGHGDLVGLLGIGTQGIPRDSVTTFPLDQPLGETRGSSVLLLGDSFANIYGDPSLGFGEDAGMQATLAHHLGVPVDALLQNDGGASKSRIALQDDVGRLDETLVVVWVFTARELSSGDWIKTPLELDAPAEVVSPYLAIGEGERHDFAGIVLSVSKIPSPDSAPYANHIITLRVRADDGQEGFVRTWSMRDRVLTSAASLSAGSRLVETLVPWSDTSATAQSASRSELSDRPRGAPISWVAR